MCVCVACPNQCFYCESNDTCLSSGGCSSSHTFNVTSGACESKYRLLCNNAEFEWVSLSNQEHNFACYRTLEISLDCLKGKAHFYEMVKAAECEFSLFLLKMSGYDGSSKKFGCFTTTDPRYQFTFYLFACTTCNNYDLYNYTP